MTTEKDTERDSAYTRTYTVPVTHAILAIALTPALDTLEAVRKLVAHELEAAYRAGQASSPSERHGALAERLAREQALMRRAIGIVSDLQRLEGVVAEVLNAYASDAWKTSESSSRLVDQLRARAHLPGLDVTGPLMLSAASRLEEIARALAPANPSLEALRAIMREEP